MAISLQPKSFAEIAADDAPPPLPDGEYDYVVTAGEQKLSQAGNEMIVVELTIKHGEKGRKVRDYLVDKPGFCHQKIGKFMLASGLGDMYRAGKIVGVDMVGAKGRLKLHTKPATDEFAARNAVRDYIIPKPKAVPAQRTRLEDDEIPI